MVFFVVDKLTSTRSRSFFGKEGGCFFRNSFS